MTGQKTIQKGLFQKGIRLDIFAKDPANTRYDVEMQTTDNPFLGRRLRCYQGKMDQDALKAGEPYNRLPDSFIIFICTFDPFGRGEYRYTITPRCEETGREIQTGQKWIILNTEGAKGNISQEVKEFLVYLKDSCRQNAANDFLREVDERVSHYRNDEEWRDTMLTFEERMEATRIELREAGRLEGLAEGRAESRAEAIKNCISRICRKLIKGQYDAAVIADAIEEDEGFVRTVVEAAKKYAPDYDVEKIYADVKGKVSK